MATAPYGDSPEAGDLRVITLASARTPMPLDVPFWHELERFTVFRSFSGEGDSAFYHLHVGYFASESRARQALEVVRRYYAFATIELAPGTGLGSLDDTLNTDFQVLQSTSARVVARNRVMPKPVQHFAVLLVRCFSPDGAAPIPRLPAFRAFSIYGVRASDDDGDCQDIRLGFFQDVMRARLFADSIRSHFPQAAVLPVSDREHARVTGLGSDTGAAAGTPVHANRHSPGNRSPAQPFPR